MIESLLIPVRLVYRLVRRLGILDVTQLLHLPAGNCHHQPCPQGYEIRCVGTDELTQLLTEKRISAQVVGGSRRGAARRVLVAAFYQGRAVSFAWLARQTISGDENFSRAEHLGTSIEMPDGMAFVFNVWTDHEHRGKRLIAALLTWATDNRASGAWSLLTMVDWTNHASRRAFRHMGMQELGFVYRLGRGRLQLSLIPESVARIGLRVAQDAPGLKWAW